MPQSQRRIIIILVAVLLAVVGTSVAIVLLLPSSPNLVPESAPVIPVRDAVPDTVEFNLSVLERSSYASLNADMIQRGLLPVLPPESVGKPNPFF